SCQEAVLRLDSFLELALRFLQGLLGAPPLADVEGAAHHPYRLPPGIADDQSLVPDVHPAPIAMAQPELGAEGGAVALKGGEDRLIDRLHVVGMDLPAPPVDISFHLLRPVAEEGEETFGALYSAVGGIPVVDQPVDGLGGQPEALFADAERLFRPAPFGDVTGDEGGARDPPGRVPDGGD